VIDANGKLLGQVQSDVTSINGGSSSAVLQRVPLSGAIPLWSVASPSLMSIHTEVKLVGNDGSLLDEAHTTFGIRKVVYDATAGLIMNDVPVKVQGMCNHQDFAGCGTALPDRVNEFKVLKQKEMGANAW
jgi:beta-galactosidase